MRVFAGCYTEKISEDLIGKGKGIYCFNFNAENGELQLEDIIPVKNPSYMTISKDGRFLYAVEESPIEWAPRITAFRINPKANNPSLTLINSQDLPGSFACHLNLSDLQSHLVVASYMSGNILVYPIDKNGGILPLSQNIRHSGSGPDKVRQEAPHPHMIYPYAQGKIFVVDLGLDLAKSYVLDSSTGQLNETPELDIIVDQGAGARHMLLHRESDYAFIFSELTAEIFSYKKNGKKFVFLESVATLPASYEEKPSGAAIRMHPNGKFLYVSNRGHNAITIFSFDEQLEKLILVGYQSSGGLTPREINIDPTGKWLLAANLDSDNIVVFNINQNTGELKISNINKNIKTVSCIQFLDD